MTLSLEEEGTKMAIWGDFQGIWKKGVQKFENWGNVTYRWLLIYKG